MGSSKRDENLKLSEQTGKRAQTKAANRQAILNAGRAVFSEVGFGAASVRDIIRKTQLASGTFYNYFKSKEEIFEALLDEQALKVRPTLRAVRRQASSYEEFIEETFRTFFNHLAADPLNFDLMRRNTGALRVRMDTAEIIAGFDELRSDIHAAIKSSLIPDVDPDYLTSAIVGIAFEMGDQMLTRDNYDPETATQFATTLVVGGIAALIVDPDS